MHRRRNRGGQGGHGPHRLHNLSIGIRFLPYKSILLGPLAPQISVLSYAHVMNSGPVNKASHKLYYNNETLLCETPGAVA